MPEQGTSGPCPLTACTALLPTYNGETFLSEQLDSCLAQPGLRILARDDCSDDSTFAILREYQERHRERIGAHRGERLGVMGNVEWLLSRFDTPYFALADQDDVWEEHKLTRLRETMRHLELRFGTGKPLLVYSDASLTDGGGKRVAPSYFASAGIPPEWGESFRNALVMSPAPGCTMMGNRALARAALPFPGLMFMHDWWLLLVANALGGVRVVHAPLVRYRQHGTNLLGAAAWNFRTFVRKCLAGPANSRRNIRLTQQQALSLLEHCGEAMPDAERRLCEVWAAMPGKPWVQRVRASLAYGFAKPGRVRNMLFYLCN